MSRPRREFDREFRDGADGRQALEPGVRQGPSAREQQLVMSPVKVHGFHVGVHLHAHEKYCAFAC